MGLSHLRGDLPASGKAMFECHLEPNHKPYSTISGSAYRGMFLCFVMRCFIKKEIFIENVKILCYI
jgi:hypothetical protein